MLSDDLMDGDQIMLGTSGGMNGESNGYVGNHHPNNLIPSENTVNDNNKQQKEKKKKKKKEKKGKNSEPHFPFKVLHQKLVIDVDLLQKSIVGYTDIKFTPLHNNTTQISLHCLQYNVSGVVALSINKHKQQVANGNSDLNTSMNGSVNNHQQSNEELKVEISQYQRDEDSSNRDLEKVYKDLVLEYNITNEGTLNITFQTPLQKKTTSTIRVYFELYKPKAGVYFVDHKVVKNKSKKKETADENRMVDDEDKMVDEKQDEVEEDDVTLPCHMYTHNQLQGARCWFPCVDLLYSYHTFEFEITSQAEAMIICSGELIRQVENYSGTLKTSYFKTNSIMSPSSVCIAIGPFNISYTTLALGSHNITFNTFYLPKYSLDSIRHTVSFFKRAFSFFEEYLDLKYKDLFNSTTFNLVFVENLFTKQAAFGTTCLIDATRMLVEKSIIDVVQPNRISLTKLIAEQYFGNFIHPKTWSDYWLIVGIAGYLSHQFYEVEFGQNAKRFFILQEGKNLLKLEKHVQTLFCEKFSHPVEMVTPYLLMKAPLVIYMIDRQISTSNMRRLLNKILTSALADQSKRYNDRLVSTSAFIKTIDKTFAVDLKLFSSYWIYGTGIPQFACSFKYDVNRSCVDLKVKQILQSPEMQPFRGKVTFRISETEGSPNDFLVDLDKDENQFEFHINAKPVKKQHKKLTGVTTEATRIKIPLKWIRMDPEQDWIKVLSFSQTQEMWRHQIEEVKDVVAQYESINALTFFKDTEEVVGKLIEILMDQSYYYQIRICAAHALSKIPQRIVKEKALGYLINFFKTQFYDEKQLYLKPNNFTHRNFAEYFIKEEIPLALTNFYDEKVNNETQPEVIQFLLELFKYNDDSDNMYSGDYYIAYLLKALSLINTPNMKFKDKIVKILHKYLVIDSDLIPSFHYVKTVYAIEGISHLQATGKIPVNMNLFYRYLDFNSSTHVRLATWQSVLTILDSTLINLVKPQPTTDNITVVTSKGEISDLLTNPLIEDVKFIFYKFLEVLQDENESAYFKHKVTSIMVNAIYQSSAQMLMQYNSNNSLIDTRIMDQFSAFGRFLIEIRAPKIENRTLVDSLWHYMLFSPFTRYDFRLRSVMVELYAAIWSSLPLCYEIRVVSSNKFNHALLLAPSLSGITDLKIVQPTQIESHKYLASDQTIIFDWSNLSTMIKPPEIQKIIEEIRENDIAATKQSTDTSSQSTISTTKKDKKKESNKSSKKESSKKEKSSTKEKEKETSKKEKEKEKDKDKEKEKEKEKDKESEKKDKKKNDAKKRKRDKEKEKESTTTTSTSSTKSSTDKKKKKKEETTKESSSKEAPPTPKLKIKLSDTFTEETKASSSNVTTVLPTAVIPEAKSEKEEKRLMEAAQKAREERKHDESRIIFINMVQTNIRMYILLDNTSTANAIYRSVTLTSDGVNCSKGIIYFAINGVEQINLESDNRAIVSNGEIAYWVSGTAIVIGYGKTEYSTGSEIRLYEPCNIFGKMLYEKKALNRSAKEKQITISRLPRLTVNIPKINEWINIDFYNLEFPEVYQHVIEQLPIHSRPELFGELIYFPLRNVFVPPKDAIHHDQGTITDAVLYRDYLLPGEVAFWVSGNALLLGTGPTPKVKTSRKSVPTEKYGLLEKCYVIGRITSGDYHSLPSKVQNNVCESLYFMSRKVKITFEMNDGKSNYMVVLLKETVTADTIFNALPLNIDNPYVDKSCLAIALDGNIDTLQHEVSSSKENVEPGEIALIWDRNNTILFAQESSKDSYSLGEVCNIWATFVSSSNNMDYSKFVSTLKKNVKNISNVIMEKYVAINPIK
ncbi:hypothetical protein ABK040_005934 [Willaertia magna]